MNVANFAVLPAIVIILNHFANECGGFRILKTLMINIYTFQRVIIFHVNYIFPAI